jgi:hypothetical protein
MAPMSPLGRPKREYRSAKHEGSPLGPQGRPKREYRSAKHEGGSSIPAIKKKAAAWRPLCHPHQTGEASVLISLCRK